MHPTSTYSPTSDTNHRLSAPYPIDRLHPQHIPQTYNVDSCVNCGHKYEYEKLRYESGGDGKKLWKLFSSVVSDHYSSCPNKLANIQPTSAIRGTLFEHNEGSWKDAKNARISFRYSPYSRNPSRHDRNLMEVGRPSIDQYPSALPEASFINSRPKASLPVESSRITADHKYALSKPTERLFSDRNTEAKKKFSNRDKLQLLPPLRQVIAHSSGLASAIDKPASFPATPTSVLPPNLDRKRNRVQLQEALTSPSSSPLSNAANARPHIILHPSVHRYVSPSVSPVLEAADTRTPIDMDVEWEKLSATKMKKNVMDWRIRRKYLLQDPLLFDVEAKRVKCGPCHKWIKLDARNDYYPGLWLKHRRTMHGNTTANSPYSSSTRRKRSKPVQEEPLTGKRDDGGSRIYPDHNQFQRSSRGPISARLRSNHSDMRITRSLSASSV